MIKAIKLAWRLIERLRWALRGLWWRMRLGELGKGARVYPKARIYHPRQVRLGPEVVLNDFVHIWGGGGVEIGADTIIAAHSAIISQTHDVAALAAGRLYRETARFEPVIIGRNVWIGTGCTILPGVRIGDNVIVGAHSLVNRDVPAGTIVMGTPAKVVRRLEGGTP
jgi:maltose O-acetyltransferase